MTLNPLHVTSGTGEYQTSLVHCAMWDRRYRAASKKMVLGLAGLNGTAFSIPNSVMGSSETHTITDAGFPYCSVANEALWGNSSMRTRMTNLKTFVQTTRGWSASGKVHLNAISAGSLACLTWAMNNPTLVQSIYLNLPLVNVQDVYDFDRGGLGLAASISTAYGGRPVDAENPSDNPSLFAGIPIMLAYSTSDPICIASEVTTFAAAVGSNVELTNMGAIGHATTSTAQDQSEWFLAND